MARLTAPPWRVRSKATPGGLRYAVHGRSNEVASGIENLADAHLIEAAPELFEFARALCALALPDASHLGVESDPREIASLCRAMAPTISRMSGKPS